MMGRHAKQTQWWDEPVNIFARIPEDHILRRLNAVLDMDFIREKVSAKYGRNGQVSVDPVVLMKMMLLLFLDDVKSERELMRIIPLRLDYLYFLRLSAQPLRALQGAAALGQGGLRMALLPERWNNAAGQA